MLRGVRRGGHGRLGRPYIGTQLYGLLQFLLCKITLWIWSSVYITTRHYIESFRCTSIILYSLLLSRTMKKQKCNVAQYNKRRVFSSSSVIALATAFFHAFPFSEKIAAQSVVKNCRCRHLTREPEEQSTPQRREVSFQDLKESSFSWRMPPSSAVPG
jgi:hypothetical protein